MIVNILYAAASNLLHCSYKAIYGKNWVDSQAALLLKSETFPHILVCMAMTSHWMFFDSIHILMISMPTDHDVSVLSADNLQSLIALG